MMELIDIVAKGFQEAPVAMYIASGSTLIGLVGSIYFYLNGKKARDKMLMEQLREEKERKEIEDNMNLVRYNTIDNNLK